MSISIVNLATPTARPGSASPSALGRGLSFAASFEPVFYNGGRQFGVPKVRVAGIGLGRSVRFERGSRVKREPGHRVIPLAQVPIWPYRQRCRS